MNHKDIRWRQRFENFEKAYKQLQSAVTDFPKLSDLEKEGLIQRYQYTFELAWKTLKDYLESQGVSASFPREVIKASFLHQIIQNGEVWMDMLEKRNLMAHTYDEVKFKLALQYINDQYFSAITQVYQELGDRK